MDEYVEYLKNEVLPELERSLEVLKERGRGFGKSALYLKHQMFFYALIEAVKKQIPAKATLCGGCPRCHRVIYKDMKYCCDCGQALEIER